MPNIKTQIQILAILPLSILPMFGSLTSLPGEQLVAQKEFSLDNRNLNIWVNDIFKNNILLNLAYLDDKVHSKDDINWDEVTKPFKYQFKLDPNKTFAFHEDVEDKYKDSLVKTTNAHFNGAEGFKTDGYLFGDGVCHLASLLYWVAKEAGLDAEAPTNHDFMPIPDIPKQYGVSIFNQPQTKSSNAKQNLYITNNKNKPVTFKFEYHGNILKVSVVED